MMERAVYDDVVREVAAELRASVARARAARVIEDAIVVDPGIGFAKTAEQNLALLRRLAELTELGRPIMVGPSRKSFIGRILDVPPPERVAGTVAACVAAFVGGARVFRVHDVAPVVQALRVTEAIARQALPDAPAPVTAAPAGAGAR
jgi:dihydropteroate synthase